MDFTPTVLAGDGTASVVLTGAGLSAIPVTGSVRSVRFELSSLCSPGAATNNTVATPTMGSVSANASETALTVPLPGGGLSAGLWSVCVDWTASAVSPLYTRVGYATQFVEVGEHKGIRDMRE